MRQNEVLPEYWTKTDLMEARGALTYKELARVGLKVLSRVYAEAKAEGKKVALVCGTITNGGKLSETVARKNLKRFAEEIARLRQRGLLVFNQLPFEEHLFRIRRMHPGDGPDALLQDFYLFIFSSRLINIASFLLGWNKSYGATWENETLTRFGVEIRYSKH